ncbi:hypothetical protein VTL71DRAFT_2654 [Oculimacula yallundae]|uniref:Uncharacterized protein n=1 Tax=Oculimacula yallundae TaxID=86028 RepID=A0ABR4C9H9_9HELO
MCPQPPLTFRNADFPSPSAASRREHHRTSAYNPTNPDSSSAVTDSSYPCRLPTSGLLETWNYTDSIVATGLRCLVLCARRT